jgi:16S rRNA (uracil1498-N3)-methyltransferase
VPAVQYPAEDPAVAHAFVDTLDDTCTLAGADGHHLQRVRRVRVGERITAADGAGQWRAYEVREVAPGALVLAALEPVRTEPVLEPRIGLALALVKGGLDHVVARCTELGVDRIEPVRTHRTVVRWDPAKAAAAVDRLGVIAREAAAQCRRARLPEIRPLTDLAALGDRPGLLLADRTGRRAGALPPPGSDGWTVLVGPEGGFDPDELRSLPATTPRLAVGPYVLRAETAPIAVLAALRA